MVGIFVTLALFLAMPELPAQAFSTLYNFSNGPDGASPDKGRLIMDHSGNLYGTTYAGGAYYQGAVFKLSARGKETILYSFKGARDGAGPIGGVVRDAFGTLYGTTSYKGAYNAGTIFSVSKDGTFKLLHTFKGGNKGGQPYASLLRDPHGDLYGTTKSGGAYGFGTIFRLSASGTFQVLYSFKGSPDGGQPTSPLIRDSAGNLYGTTSAEGLFRCGTVFVFDKNGNERILHDFTGSLDGIAPLGGVTFDAAGNLYGATSAGGPFNLGMVYVIEPSGRESTVLNFGGFNGSYPVGEIWVDGQGALYGTTAYGGDFGDGVVWTSSPTVGFVILHHFNGSDGFQPYAGVIQDSAGNLYGTTRFGGSQKSGTVFRIVP